ncbi:Aste57867_18914 [Aphanomyces stellatus]|uniref:Aste57867_18914 protein n=1 Tax=Aphanomyces stellatus TaxID=120398 RepID=A0A485LBJ6_9STRA|nr:hypothetical protein As57867_018850 [Aphanomyces stellatus]VFT95646.1 Aste57867_18914 [Aphanomyces stellatus]
MGDVDAARAEVRLRRTLKMQRYRKRLIEKADCLRDEVTHLQNEIDAYMRRQRGRSASLLLPWKDVAKGLEDESELVAKDNRALKQLCLAQQQTMWTLHRWVVANLAIVTCPNAETQTWRYVTVCADPASRLCAFEWIAQHMQHNTDRVFQQFGFPAIASSTCIDDFSVEYQPSQDVDDGLQFIWRDQRELPYPMEAVRDWFARPHCLNMVGAARANWPTTAHDRDVVAEDDRVLELQFGGTLRYIHNVRRGGKLIHILFSEWCGLDRCVFATQGIRDDERLPNDAVQRNRMSWFVLDRLGPTRTKMRALNVMSQHISSDGFVSFEEEAVDGWGIDFPMDVPDMASVERRVVQRMIDLGSGGGDWFNTALRDAMERATAVRSAASI